MPILPICLYPEDHVLRQKSKKIRHIDSSIQQLIDNMTDTMQQAHGVGLAASQVGVLLRVIVLQMPGEQPFAIINPEIIERMGERDVIEGCLSIPGYVGEIKRSASIKLRGKDRIGTKLKITAEDLLAEALEHEVDHLNGILYIDYLESQDKLHKVEPKSEEEQLG